MTTIAWDGNILAADSLVLESSTGEIVEFTNKIKHIDIFDEKNRFVGKYFICLCGDYLIQNRVLDWLTNDTKGIDPPKGEYHGIIIKIDKFSLSTEIFEIYCDLDSWAISPLKIKYSFGAGSTIARAAMTMGSTAKEAVELAKKLNVFTGGKVNYIDLEKEKEKISKKK